MPLSRLHWLQITVVQYPLLFETFYNDDKNLDDWLSKVNSDQFIYNS